MPPSVTIGMQPAARASKMRRLDAVSPRGQKQNLGAQERSTNNNATPTGQLILKHFFCAVSSLLIAWFTSEPLCPCRMCLTWTRLRTALLSRQDATA